MGHLERDFALNCDGARNVELNGPPLTIRHSPSSLSTPSPRQERPPSGRVRHVLDRGAVERGENRLVEHGRGRTFRQQGAVRRRSARSAKRRAWFGSCVVKATARPSAARARMVAHDFALVAEIEARGRLVEDDDARLLRQRPGDEGELPLAAGDQRVGPLGEGRRPSRSSIAAATARSWAPGRGRGRHARCGPSARRRRR